MDLTLPVEQFTQVRYRCPYCHRSWSKLKTANKHRDKCWKRPGGCKTCHFAETIGGDYVTGCELGLPLAENDVKALILAMDCPEWRPA